MAIVQPVPTDSGPRRLRVTSPATGETIGDIRVTPADEVRAAIARARAAQPAWEALGFKGRARYMRRALKILLANQE